MIGRKLKELKNPEYFYLNVIYTEKRSQIFITELSLRCEILIQAVKTQLTKAVAVIILISAMLEQFGKFQHNSELETPTFDHEYLQ